MAELSLLLKMPEGVTQTNLVIGRILADLGKNIFCGNSLIGSDFYDNRQGVLFDEEEMYQVNAFDWATALPKILGGANPGFDTVIGNLPWVSLSSRFGRSIVSKIVASITKPK